MAFLLSDSQIDAIAISLLTIIISITIHGICIIVKNSITKFVFPRTTNYAYITSYGKINHYLELMD
ncbi:hypothetical protein NEPAR06_1146 [Nematocida parisii]|uniref:Uncharacterized protein n=1 Tax=Nematocida parisii (strain ERTm3) TaxID=935791 RepID=I3EKP9_NEMP3|nr:uncharacterized protein NEPG_00666 [Nematocida parisii ERTm1]EIJ89796.1 hypothetical protein NEQG_00566 [Nematocida parisii ERTm3]KAI5128511.1 hypothetical protein NEPAR08_1269 [Nematocida parisii]KAI5166029.1 hypothetical protein NEIRO02_0898 [Nematocida sp. AWRm79]KAI5183066.1 hypothetical protein NEIRO03_0690 [Nematocida sp. AWRm78]OAG32533.1 hypothetical protein NEIG_01643 [Nematocida sp. ERTm5]|eukprot:XP_013058497.1 hypothetical protein NEPG_00666 [Nematocida parisii ERTm1]